MNQIEKGQRGSGFRVIDVSALPDYKAEGVLFEHERTGFQVYYVRSSDRERFFCYTVYTPPENSKGIAHIIEHTVLAGSERYPVKDPFMLLARNSCNTFLNALTGVDRTYYPAASTVMKDFDNIFSVYTDAVFSPLLRRETFMQEGIRLSGKGGLHFEGVVFSEMLGEMAEHEFVLSSLSTKPLFGDSPYRYESGGDGRKICRLSYEEYRAAYSRFYVPANMTLFLYGDMDIWEKLSYLDREYLSQRDGGRRTDRIQPAARWSSPRKAVAASPAEDGDEGASVMVSWLLGDNAQAGESTLLSLMVDLLLGSSGCPLYKAIAESDLGTDLSSESGMSSSYRDLVFSAGFSGAREEDAERSEEYILSSLRKIVSDGFGERAVEAAIRRMEFSLKEIPGGMPMGMRLFFQAEKALTFGTDPALMLAPSSIIASIRRRWEEDPRFFEHWIERNLLDNPHRLLAVVRKDSRERERIDSAIAAALEERKDEYSAQEEAAFDAFQAWPDSAEALSSVPRLTVEDLPSSFDRIGHEISGQVVSAPMVTGGVVYTDIVFDISDLDYDELDAANLYSRLLSMCDAGDMDYSTLQTELRFVSGGYAFFVESGSTVSGEARVFLVCRLKSLPGLEKDGLDLFLRLFKEGRIDDERRIRAALTDISTDYQSSIVQSGQTYAMSAAAASLSPSLYIGERLTGISCWYTVEDMLSSDLAALGRRLIAVRDRIITRARAIVHVTAEREDMEEAVEAARGFLAALPDGDGAGRIERVVPQLPRLSAFTLSSSVSFVGIAGRGRAMADPLSSSDRIFLSILSTTGLWSLVREKGGAYGVGAYLDYVERIWSFYSYRDPRLDGTIDDLRRAVEGFSVTEEQLSDALIAEFSRSLKPTVPAIRSLVDIRRILYRITDEEREQKRREIRSLSREDIMASRERFLASLSDQAIAVVADRSVVDSSRYGFDARSLPFSSVVQSR